MDILSIFSNNNGWEWASLAVLLFIFELILGTTFLLWLGVAAAICAIIFAFNPNATEPFQFITFSILAIISVLLGRKFMPINNANNDAKINQPNERMIGEEVIVTDDFHGGIGAVSHGDTRWRALCKESSPKTGDVLKIIKIEGATLFVEK